MWCWQFNPTILSENIPGWKSKGNLILGTNLADHIASFGGAGLSLFSFLAHYNLDGISIFLILITQPFDPFPLIFIKSDSFPVLRPSQAPIIWWAKIVKNLKDRQKRKAEHRFIRTIWKAELEIKLWGDKNGSAYSSIKTRSCLKSSKKIPKTWLLGWSDQSLSGKGRKIIQNPIAKSILPIVLSVKSKLPMKTTKPFFLILF